MQGPQLWIVAGPNGAGKTTCVQRIPVNRIIPRVRFLNPDDLTRSRLLNLGFTGFDDTPPDVLRQLFIQSAEDVLGELKIEIAANRAVGVETVLSTDKYCPLVEQVLRVGGFVGLLYVAVSSPELSRLRIASRVKSGGHDVPTEKIADRFTRSLANLAWFATHASAFWVVDNSGSDTAAALPILAHGTQGRLDYLSDAAFPAMKQAVAFIPRRR